MDIDFLKQYIICQNVLFGLLRGKSQNQYKLNLTPPLEILKSWFLNFMVIQFKILVGITVPVGLFKLIVMLYISLLSITF